MKSTEPNVRNHWLDSWHVSPSTNRDYDFIDGLRGIAILMVIVAHHFYVNPKAGPTTLGIGAVLGMNGHGVTLFFALSGFLIAWPFWKRKVTGAQQPVPSGYAQRRFWKIYPPLALSVLVFVPICIATSGDWSFISIGAKWLAGLPFLLPVSGKFNPVMWTLVIEAQFYMTLPLVFLALRRVPPKLCLWMITLVFLIVPVSFRVITGLAPAFHPDINSHFPAALDAFYLGILVAGLESMGLLKKSWAWVATLGVVLWPLAVLASAWLFRHPESKNVLTVEAARWALQIAAGCLLFFVANPQHSIARLLCAPALRWCGIISYEWYLFHQPIASWVRNGLGPAHGDVLKYATIVFTPMVIGVVIAAVVYRKFSLPILKYGRDKNRR